MKLCYVADMRFILAIAALTAAVPAQAADQFDLVCRGGREKMHYRIDLIRREYCFGKCEKLLKISEVTSGMITLIDVKPSLPSDVTAYNRINRMSGEWEWYNRSPKLSTSVQNIRGHCEAAPFSSFPAAKF